METSKFMIAINPETQVEHPQTDSKLTTSSFKKRAAAGWANNGVLNFLANGEKSTVKLIVEIEGQQYFLDKFTVVKNATKTDRKPDVYFEFDIKNTRPLSRVTTTTNTVSTTEQTLEEFGF